MATDVDVLIIGAVACGLAAAIAAHDSGAAVAIIEKLDRPGSRHTFIQTRYGVGYKLEAEPKP